MTQPDWPGRGHEYMTRLERLAIEHPRQFVALLAVYYVLFWLVLVLLIRVLYSVLEGLWLHI